MPRIVGKMIKPKIQEAKEVKLLASTIEELNVKKEKEIE